MKRSFLHFKFSIRYDEAVQNNPDKSQHQVLEILKFLFASIAYNGNEIAIDFLLMMEYTYFMNALQIDILRLFLYVPINSNEWTNWDKYSKFINKMNL